MIGTMIGTMIPIPCLPLESGAEEKLSRAAKEQVYHRVLRLSTFFFFRRVAARQINA